MSGSGSTCRARTPAARADERVAAPQAETTTTPVDGVFAVHTVAGVVTPAQALLVVEPLKSHVEVKAGASNRDTGFVSPRQDAEIKVDTFNFTRHGVLPC